MRSINNSQTTDSNLICRILKDTNFSFLDARLNNQTVRAKFGLGMSFSFVSHYLQEKHNHKSHSLITNVKAFKCHFILNIELNTYRQRKQFPNFTYITDIGRYK